jgi:uncharacterized protein (TIGR02646 family)
MRPISKDAEPTAFTGWKKGGSPDWAPGWDDLDGTAIKSTVKEALLREQGYVCCYCEQPIGKADSHIEHLESRHHFTQRSLDYANLLACCTREEPRVPRHCGSRKGDRSLKVHPLLPDCREYFVFTGLGDVRPTDVPARQELAREAISILGLDIGKLVAMRKKAIDGVMQELAGVEPERARAALARLDERNAQGRNEPFASAILSVFQPHSPA